LLTWVRDESAEMCEVYRKSCRFGLTPQLEIDPSLENARIFQASVKPPAPVSLPPTVQFAKTFHIGDSLSFTIRNNNQKDGYLVILDVDTKGNVNSIFPNADVKNHGYIQAGQTVTIPNPDPDDFLEFTAGEPIGKSAVIIVIAGDQTIAQQIQTVQFCKKKGIQVNSSRNTAQSVAEQAKQELSKMLSGRGSFISLEYEILP